MIFFESSNRIKRIEVINARPMVSPNMQRTTNPVRGAKNEIPSPTRKVTITKAKRPKRKLIALEKEDATAKT
mgnify:CR=1 FL=1